MPRMETVCLGRSGIRSSVLGLGGGSSGRFGLVKGTKSDALRLIGTALDLGITLFDGGGLAGGVDGLLADGLGAKRDTVVVSTKIHLGPETYSSAPLPNRASSWLARRSGFVCSAAVARKRVEQTLRALRTDRVDILHLHAVTPAQYPLAVERVLPELLRLKDQEKVRAIGITEGFLSDPTHEMLSAAARDAHLDVVMTGCNFVNSSAVRSVLPLADQAKLGVVGMFALRGLQQPGFRATLSEVAREVGASGIAELAYRYARYQRGMHAVLTGTGDANHLRQNVNSISRPALPAEAIEKLERIAAADQEGGAVTRK